jgi:hypothetical protein
LSASFDERRDDLFPVFGVRVKPPTARVWNPQHEDVDAEAGAVPALLCLAAAEDDDAEVGEERD